MALRVSAPVQGDAASGPRVGARLDAWFARQAAREARSVYLEQALLTDEFRLYACYRLRYFFLRYLTEAALHAVRFLLLYRLFSEASFIHLVLVTAVAGLLGSFWWGALEVLRGRVRERFRSGKPHLVPAEIARWLALAALVAAMVFLLPVGWIAWNIGHAGEAFGLVHLYVLAVGLRLSLEILTLTFHSGVYAVRRIYRPLTAIVALELVGFLVTLSLWPVLGPWSFPIAMLAGTFASTAVLVHFTARLYRFFGFVPLPWPVPARVRWLPGSAIRELFAAGAAHALMKLDAFLVLALLHVRSGRGEPVQLFALFFGISPIVRAGFEWAQLFYFDLKRLEVRTFANLKRRYDRFLWRLALAMGVLFWALACLCGTLALQRSLGGLYWLLGPFFISRSALGLVQVRVFSERRYTELLGSGVLLLAGMSVLRIWVPSAQHRLALLSLLTLPVIALLGSRWLRKDGQPGAAAIRSLPEWLAELRSISEPVRVRSVRLWIPRAPRRQMVGRAREIRWRQRQIAERIARRFGAHGAVTTLRSGWVAWYERDSESWRRGDAWVLALAGGLLQWTGSSGVQKDGLTAVEVARRRHLLGSALYPRRNGHRPARSLSDLQQSFLAMVPDGVVHAPDLPAPQILRTLSSREKRQILLDATYFVTELRVRPSLFRFEVTALAAGPDLRGIFLAPRSVDPHLRRRWAELISHANLDAALRSRSPSRAGEA